jgi:hypothetical protein
MLPKPDTLSAVLMSEGLWRPTWHTYLETREVDLPMGDGSAYEYIYVCSESGVERRWGTRHRLVTTVTERLR